MAYNAIRVSNQVEKIELDFSTYEGLQETSGVKRFYTIHTEKTNQMTEKLGFHVGGFCDDRGRGGPRLAAEISGYEYLPSDLFLCKMDSRYDYLPLSEAEVDALFDLLTGKPKAKPAIMLNAQAFLERNMIQPILPEFNLKMEPMFFNQYPNVMAICYDEKDLKDDREREEYGKALFTFADRIVNKMEKVGQFNLAKDGTYYLCNYRKDGCFYCIIQARQSLDEPCIIQNVIDILNCF